MHSQKLTANAEKFPAARILGFNIRPDRVLMPVRFIYSKSE